MSPIPSRFLVLPALVPAAAVLAALAPLAGAQTTWYVDAGSPAPGSGTQANPYASIQYAITRPTTLSGDTVLVYPGTYVENVVFGGKSIVLKSTAGPQSTVIDGHNADSCVQIVNQETSATVLEGFTLTHGLPGSGYGGGLRAYTSSPQVRNCVVRGNTAAQEGGGIWLGFGNAAVERCVVAGNTVTGGGGQGSGGGLYCMYGFNASVTNCTFDQNSAAYGASMKIDYGGNVIVKNTILWGTPGNAVVSYQATPTFSYCDVQGSLSGAGNFDVDPQFWNPLAGDYHLKPGSICIDAGDPAGPTDPDGSVADVGAYPFDPSYCAAPTFYCTAKTNSQGCVPAIAYTGLPSASVATSFRITASRVINNKTGLLLYAYASAATPWQGGTLCLGAPLKRTPVQNSFGNPGPSDCSGGLSIDFNARIQSGIDPQLVAGATVFAQYYYRDPPASFGVGLTDAVSFTICP